MYSKLTIVTFFIDKCSSKPIEICVKKVKSRVLRSKFVEQSANKEQNDPLNFDQSSNLFIYLMFYKKQLRLI